MKVVHLVMRMFVYLRKNYIYVESRYDSHICNYFFGRLEITSITRHLQLFKIAYPKCDIVYDILSDINNLYLNNDEQIFAL